MQKVGLPNSNCLWCTRDENHLGYHGYGPWEIWTLPGERKECMVICAHCMSVAFVGKLSELADVEHFADCITLRDAVILCENCKRPLSECKGGNIPFCCQDPKCFYFCPCRMVRNI